MENPRIKQLTEKARTGSLSMDEKNELTGLLKPTPPPVSGPDALGTKMPTISEEEFNQKVKEEMARKPTTIVTAKSDQLGSIPKVVELPSKNMDKYQNEIEAGRLNRATVPSESNEGKLPPFPIMNKTEEPVAKVNPVAATKTEVPVVEKVAEPAAEVAKSETPTLDADKPVKDKKGFGTVIKELATKYGVPLLEILEAVGKYRGGITTPTVIERKYAAQLEKEQADYMNKLSEARATAEEERQNKLLERQQAFEASQNELNRIADKEARGIELSSKEKLLKMELAASGANKKAPTSASIIPE